jgi:hypothetical protein
LLLGTGELGGHLEQGFFARPLNLLADPILGLRRPFGGLRGLLADGVLKSGSLLDGAGELGRQLVESPFGRLVNLLADRNLALRRLFESFLDLFLNSGQ